MTEEEKLLRAAERGAWFAFDAVLGWINTQTEKHIDKDALYRAVMDMRPGELDALKGDPILRRIEQSPTEPGSPLDPRNVKIFIDGLHKILEDSTKGTHLEMSGEWFDSLIGKPKPIEPSNEVLAEAMQIPQRHLFPDHTIDGAVSSIPGMPPVAAFLQHIQQTEKIRADAHLNRQKRRGEEVKLRNKFKKKWPRK